MKFQAIMFMCNDFERAFFTLHTFRRHHPDIKIRVVNSGGEDPTSRLKYLNVEVVQAPNLWHKKTLCGVGSFGPEFADYLFDYGLNEEFTHTLMFETDVLTNRRVTVEPKYDISGPTNPCGHNELKLYDYLNINENKIHTGCGGTMFSLNYFKKIKENNYDFFVNLFNKFPQHYFMDMILTLAARVNGLSFGHWEEVSNVPVHVVNGKMVNVNYSATLVHNFKI